MGVLLLKYQLHQPQLAAAVEWEDELLYHTEEIVLEAYLEGDPCLDIEVFIHPLEVMDILLK